MNNFDDIKNIWQQQSQDAIPNLDQIRKAIRKNRLGLIVRNLLLVLMLGGTLVLMFVIWTRFDFKYMSTGIGIIITSVAVVMGLIFKLQLLRISLSHPDDTPDSMKYLSKLISYRQKQNLFETRGLTVYFILLGCGMAFYFYEFLQMSLVAGLTAYVATAIWFAFAWFYLRPRMLKKNNAKIEQLIAQVAQMHKQMEA